MKSPNPLDFVSAVTFGGASYVLFSTPNLNEGAVEDGSGAADFLDSGDAFDFASKSPKPLVVGATDFVGTGDFGFSSIFEIFGDSGF